MLHSASLGRALPVAPGRHWLLRLAPLRGRGPPPLSPSWGVGLSRACMGAQPVRSCGGAYILHTVDKRGSDAKLGFLGKPGFARQCSK